MKETLRNSAFTHAVAALAVAGPFILVVFAYASTFDPVQRAHLVVAGHMRLVLALFALGLGRALWNLGRASARAQAAATPALGSLGA